LEPFYLSGNWQALIWIKFRFLFSVPPTHDAPKQSPRRSLNQSHRRSRPRIALLQQEVEDYYSHFRVTTDLIELRNLLQTAELIVRSALARKESRGLHYNTDFPDLADETVVTVLVL
jgi:hypothetical protein